MGTRSGIRGEIQFNIAGDSTHVFSSPKMERACTVKGCISMVFLTEFIRWDDPRVDRNYVVENCKSGSENFYVVSEMVNTRSRPLNEGEMPEDISSNPNPVVRVANVVPPGMPPIFTGPEEMIPRVELASTNPVIQDANPQADMVASVMQMVTSAMEKQQEAFLKMLEDRDASLKRPEVVAENAVAGTGGTGGENRTKGVVVLEAGQTGKGCSYKSFMGCKPPEFAGADDPVACMRWLREMEQAFRACGCDESHKLNFGSQMLRVMEEYCNEQEMDLIEDEFRALSKGDLSVKEYTLIFMEKLNLVGHVAPTEKEKMKAYLKGLPADMGNRVHNSKDTNLREIIEEAKIMERVYARDKE
ncbi:hypothetical protein L6452_08346 [Arctium lappa]|uniref:Uncharacterized protein n=1 Tax=Arctium lappa TaxID=4217 RepID=A0ACB9DH18_ARCLA|nr:hypothetical protein L6452_08346 [Arctium lappa]